MHHIARSLLTLTALVGLGACSATPPPAAPQAPSDPAMPLVTPMLDTPQNNNMLQIASPGPSWRVHYYGTFGESPRALAVAFDEWSLTTIRFDRIRAQPGLTPAAVARSAFAQAQTNPLLQPAIATIPVLATDAMPAASFGTCTPANCVEVYVTTLPDYPGVLIQATAKGPANQALFLDGYIRKALEGAKLY